MADQQPIDRFKPDMPEIPGIAAQPGPKPPSNPATRFVAGLLVVLVLVFVGARMVLRTKHVEPPVPQPTPQIEVPAPAPDPTAAIPRSTQYSPQIATVNEVGKPWSSKQFFFQNRLTGEAVSSLLLRLPTGSGTQPDGYWAFSLNSAYGNCQLEYVTDLKKLSNDYDFHSARHPMVGNPCSHTLFDPLKMTTVPGDFLVRGAIAQGSDVRPPLGIELKIQGKDILAVRME